MADFTPVSALLGGALIGLAASSFLLTNGRIAGVSGILGGLFAGGSAAQGAGAGGAGSAASGPEGAGDRRVRLWFLAGLALAGLVARLFVSPVGSASEAGLWLPALAGLAVGVGTQLGSGCTSGHGVCGLSRLSARSLVATLTFIATGVLTVAVLRALGGLS